MLWKTPYFCILITIMEDTVLMIIGVSILLAAVVGIKSGITTALLEILAGIVIGNIIHIDLPLAIETLSGLGLITLMFMAGLEIDLSFLRKKGKSSVKNWSAGLYYSLCSNRSCRALVT